ncbi:MAG: hypothetical protein H7144_14610 [Burkholderiales bacterium]|nr:hypothetical protein [Phycisphaerae bacterium]
MAQMTMAPKWFIYFATLLIGGCVTRQVPEKYVLGEPSDGHLPTTLPINDIVSRPLAGSGPIVIDHSENAVRVAAVTRGSIGYWRESIRCSLRGVEFTESKISRLTPGWEELSIETRWTKPSETYRHTSCQIEIIVTSRVADGITVITVHRNERWWSKTSREFHSGIIFNRPAYGTDRGLQGSFEKQLVFYVGESANRDFEYKVVDYFKTPLWESVKHNMKVLIKCVSRGCP